MSKSGEKRAKQKYDYALKTMNYKTEHLRERYYSSYVQFNTQELQDKLDVLNEKLQEIGEDGYTRDLKFSISKVQMKLNRIYTNQLVWLQEAKNSFDAKLHKVSQRLVELGVVEGRLEVQDTWIEDAQEMSFIINGLGYDKNGDDLYFGTAHARMIWVDCYEKVSHWRFITTLRDKPGTKNNPIENKVEDDTKQTGLSRQAQVALEAVQGRTAKQIADKLNMNVSYVYTLLRKAAA